VRFAATANDGLFAIAGPGLFRRTGAGWTQLKGMALPGGVDGTLPTDQPFQALTADPTTSPPTLYVATSDGVFQSQDDGASWLPFSQGLPTNPNCQDLRFVQEPSGVTFIYLATFGWSVFRRMLNFEEVLKPVTVVGQMKLIDRVLIGTDDIKDFTLNNMRQLGPLHPVEQLPYVADDSGGEVRVALTLDFAWKIDFSVTLSVSADLISRDEDNAVSDHQAGSVVIPFGQTEHVVIDLVSDEIEPDRAHIELDVTNG
jgi:hypothetical protein